MIPPNWRDSVTERKRAAVEDVFAKAARVQTLAMGLVYFISEAFRGGEVAGLVRWASEIAKDTLRSSVEV